ncbi:MAG: Hsp20/alpha crystallin family protein [Candidatus Dormibacteria bacterium]
MTRWDPWSDLFALQGELTRLAHEGPARGRGASQLLPLDIRQTDQEYLLEASVPGFRPEEVEVTWEQGVLTIRGEHRGESELKGEYLRRERRQQSFWRQLTLPQEVKDDEIRATFEDGVLTVRIPRVAAPAARRITVETGSSQPALEPAGVAAGASEAPAQV